MPSSSAVPFSFDQPDALIERMIANIEKAIVGKRQCVEHTVIALLCGGHILLEDVPGVGKTTLARALAKTVDASYKRIQFTPDLLPSDVIGVSIYNQKSQQFEFRQGPVFANILLADELNRTTPRTQSALLEAMEEQQVTVDGTQYVLPEPFLLIATQNPVETEGTFRLPEAQLDRFLLRIRLGYPEFAQEVHMLERIQQKASSTQLRPVLVLDELLVMQRAVRNVFVDESLKHYIVTLTSATRKQSDVLLGASPRASAALMLASQGKAFMMGRTYVIPDDIKQMAAPVLSHRITLYPEARYAGKTGEAIVQSVLAQTIVPSTGTEFAG